MWRQKERSGWTDSKWFSYCISKQPPNPVHIKIWTGSGTCLKIDGAFEIWNFKEQGFSPAVLHLHICQNAHGLTLGIPSGIPLLVVRTMCQDSLGNYPVNTLLPSCFRTPNSFLWSVEMVYYIHYKPFHGSHCQAIPTEMKIAQFWSWPTTASELHSRLWFREVNSLLFNFAEVFLHSLGNILFHVSLPWHQQSKIALWLKTISWDYFIKVQEEISRNG